MVNGFQTPQKTWKTLENQTTDDEGYHHKHHHHHHHHIELKGDRKSADFKTKEIGVHTSIYTSSVNTKLVVNKSEASQPQLSSHKMNSIYQEEDSDLMNIPCENAAVQPLFKIQRTSLQSSNNAGTNQYINNQVIGHDHTLNADINLEFDQV